MFHGISGEVTVSESSSARERLMAARPRRAYSNLYMRSGKIIEMYWSAVIILAPIQVNNVMMIRLVEDCANSSAPYIN